MKTLIILRHGKAGPEEQAGDHARALSRRGKLECEQIGQLLRDERLLPERILSSSALRARETAQRVAAAARLDLRIDELPELYLAAPSAYITALVEHAGAAECVLVVGHNPGLEELTLALTGELISLPTAGLAVCALPIAGFAELRGKLRGELRLIRSPGAPGTPG